jgi:hypothetical protein
VDEGATTAAGAAGHGGDGTRDGVAPRTWRWWLPRVVVFGPLGAGWLARRRHRSRTARRLAGDHRPGATPGRRHPSEVVRPVLAADRSGAAAPPPGGDRPGGPR